MTPVTLVWLAAVGCAVAPARLPTRGYPVKELSRRQLFSEGRLIGSLRELEIQQPQAPIRYFRVETPSGAWVGNIDQDGRFFRCEPFRDQPVDIGMFSMNKGLGRLFDIRSPIRISDLDQEKGA